MNAISHLRAWAFVSALTVGLACGAPTPDAQAPVTPEDLQSVESAVGPAYNAASLGSRNFYRTNTDTQTAAVTCRSANVSQATYDSATNTTFIVYSAGLTSAGRSRTNPYIMAFHHSTGTWEGPREIFDVYGQRAPQSDCHNYPQVVVNQGRLHVFHTMHNSGVPIQYFYKNAAGSLFDPFTASQLPGTGNNTYGAAFVDNQGELYVFYRATHYGNASTGRWYEPQMYVKSTNNGASWTAPQMLIDPGCPSEAGSSICSVTRVRDSNGQIAYNDGYYNTIYVGDYEQDTARNRIGMEWSVSRSHSTEFAGRTFIYFDLTNDVVTNVAGTSYGPWLVRQNYLDGCCNVFNGNWVMDYMDQNRRALSFAIAYESPSTGYPTLYAAMFETATSLTPYDFNYYVTGYDRLKKAVWNGSQWVISYVGGTSNPNLDPFIQPDATGTRVGVSTLFDVEYRSGLGTDIVLKTKWGGTPPAGEPYQYPARLFNSNQGWGVNARLFGDHPTWEVRGISNFNFIKNPHPSMRAFMKMPKYTPEFPSTTTNAELNAIGADYVWGE